MNLTENQKDKIHSLYLEGVTISALSQRFGVSSYTIRRALKERGIAELRKPLPEKPQLKEIGGAFRWENVYKNRGKGRQKCNICNKNINAHLNQCLCRENTYSKPF